MYNLVARTELENTVTEAKEFPTQVESILIVLSSYIGLIFIIKI